MTTLLIIICLIGVIPSYFIYKWVWKNNFGWTNKDKSNAIFFSVLFGWLCVPVILILHLIFIIKRLGKPATW